MATDSLACLRVREVAVTSIEIYRVYARSIVGMAVRSCSKAIFAVLFGHGKSPCFSALGFLTTADIDARVSIFSNVDGVVFHE
jgi:hypothetical protein